MKEFINRQAELNCVKCPHIHPDNGNCTAVGGFCTAVPAAHCRWIPELREELARVTAERDAVAKDVKRIVRRWDNGEELVQVCADFCANNNGVCVRHAELGRFDECKGFAYRGPQKEE